MLSRRGCLLRALRRLRWCACVVRWRCCRAGICSAASRRCGRAAGRCVTLACSRCATGLGVSCRLRGSAGGQVRLSCVCCLALCLEHLQAARRLRWRAGCLLRAIVWSAAVGNWLQCMLCAAAMSVERGYLSRRRHFRLLPRRRPQGIPVPLRVQWLLTTPAPSRRRAMPPQPRARAAIVWRLRPNGGAAASSRHPP